MNNDLLPLGSIVKLNGVDDKVMIIGVSQIDKEKVKYDYCGCIHPYGFVNSNNLLVFNNSDITEIVFKGYFDEESKDFYEDLLWLNEKNKEVNNE